MSERAAARGLFMKLLDAEIERRRQAKLEAAGDPVARLLVTLDGMAERMQASPDWLPPSREEAAEDSAFLTAWFARRAEEMG